MSPRRRSPLPRAILAGEQEGAFDHLPETVIANLRRPHSENARLWNTFYPRPGDGLRLEQLLSITPLWGSAPDAGNADRLEPYFWGVHPSGRELEGLSEALDEVDGPGPRTEIDLLLRGTSNLVVIEARTSARSAGAGGISARCAPRSISRRSTGSTAAGTGRCLRPGSIVCSISGPDQVPVRRPRRARGTISWHAPSWWGMRWRGRTQLRLHVWVLVPRNRWPALERTWLDFVEGVRDPDLWRRLRVVAWDQVRSAT